MAGFCRNLPFCSTEINPYFLPISFLSLEKQVACLLDPADAE
jgi:hypothetical protein